MKKSVCRFLAALSVLACLTVVSACQKEPDPDIQISDSNSSTAVLTHATTTGTQTAATTTTTTTTTTNTNTNTTAVKPTSKPTSKPTAGTAASAFPDTLFIGDSRTYGFVCYNIDVPGATFFCAESLNVYTVMSKAIEVPGVGEVTLEQLLKQKQFKQVYMMFGLNEIGSAYSATVGKYQQVIDLVSSTQTDAKFVIQSALHVSKEVSDKNISSGKVFNNDRINALNAQLTELADNKTVFYVNINTKFDDANGGLSTDYAAGDGMHLKVGAYAAWRDYLYANRIA